MKHAHLRLALALSDHIYQGMVYLFPPTFRRAFGPRMVRLFRECCRAAVQQQGMKGLICLWPPILADFSVNLVLEWGATLRRQTSSLWPALLAPLLGWLAGYAYLHAAHLEGLALFLLLCVLGAGLLGSLQPRGAPEWALLIGAGVPCVHFFDLLTGVHLPCPLYLLATLLAVVAALVGAYSGVVLGAFIRRRFLCSA